MDKTIWKYELTMADKQYIEMPHGAEILCVQLQNDTPFLWALVTPKLAKENRLFEIFGTGHPISPKFYRKYIGTFQLPNAELVFHLFEKMK